MARYQSVSLVFCMGIAAHLVGCDRSAPTTPTAGESHSHNGDHQHGPGGHDNELPAVQVTSFSDRLEAFVEHPALIAGQAAVFLIHLTDLATGEPIYAGPLTCQAVGPAGVAASTILPLPKRPGLFTPSLKFERAGEYALEVELGGFQAAGRISIGKLTVYADEAAARAAMPDGDTAVASGIPFLMEQQWKIRMRLATAQARTLVEHFRVTGEIEAPPDQRAVVSSPLPGRLLAPEDKPLPRLGEAVAAGQLLALVETPLLMSAETAERSFDIRLKAYEVAEAREAAEARLDFAQSEYARLSGLHALDTASQRELREAEREIRIAEAEYQTSLAMEDWLGGMPQRYPELHLTSQPSTRELDGGRMTSWVPMFSPIDGRIDAVQAGAGENLTVHEPVFTIIGTQRLWVVAEVSEFDLGSLRKADDAMVIPHAYPDGVFRVREAGGRLLHRALDIDETSRTARFVFEIPNADGQLLPGMCADVFLASRRCVEAIAVPDEAVVRDAGRSVVFVLLEGEQFERREVETGIREGGFVEIRSGLAEGERVVTRGAVALKLQSRLPAGAGHGHVH